MLETFLQAHIFGLMLLFTRVGTALFVMPGIGDGFIPVRFRLLFALAFSLVIMPPMMPFLPGDVPPFAQFLQLLVNEFIIGFFIGMVGRILAMALDTAGMIISIQSSFANAQIFNPSLHSQGSIIGVFMVIAGVLFLMVTNLHHMMLAGLLNSYQSFPIGASLPPGDMLEIVTQAVVKAFAVGFHIAAPLIVVITVFNAGMGILSRLMPALNVFMLALPVQLMLSLLVFMLIIGFDLMFWGQIMQDGIDMYYQINPIGSDPE